MAKWALHLLALTNELDWHRRFSYSNTATSSLAPRTEVKGRRRLCPETSHGVTASRRHGVVCWPIMARNVRQADAVVRESPHASTRIDLMRIVLLKSCAIPNICGTEIDSVPSGCSCAGDHDLRYVGVAFAVAGGGTQTSRFTEIEG
eukprot:COSAG02_NODE_2846_length_7905_cov_14.993378_1_plen_146_part_10